MDDGVDAVLAHHHLDESLVPHVADDEGCPRIDGPDEAGGEIVEDDDPLARIKQFETMWLRYNRRPPVTSIVIICLQSARTADVAAPALLSRFHM